MTPVHSRQGVGEAVERFAWAAGVYEDEQMLADINTIRAALADQSGDLTDMVSRPSLEPIQLSGNTGELPATTELSKNLGQLKSLEPPASDELSGISGELPPASDVAGWLALVMANVNRVYGDGLGPLKGLSELDPIQRNAWLEEAGLVLNGKSPLAAAPPHPASKEVGADELQGLIVTHEIAAERMDARIAELERENARLLNAFDGIVDQPASHGEGGA